MTDERLLVRRSMLAAMRQGRLILVALALLCRAAALADDPVASDPALDEFDDLKGWSTSVSEGASLEIAQDTGHTGMGMRLDFDT